MIETNQQHQRLIRFASTASVCNALMLIGIKVVGYSLTGSVAVMASLIDSVVDSLASILLFFAIRYAQQGADEHHRFGKGKAETLAAFTQTLFISVSLIMLVLHVVDRIIQPQPIRHASVGIWLMVISTVFTLGLLMIQKYVIAKTRSDAIRADALHYLTDVLMNLSIIAGIVMVGMGYQSVDAYIALAIVVYIARETYGVAKDAAGNLMDKRLSDEVEAQIRQIAQLHPEVLGVHELRTRQSGQTAFVQLHLELDAQITLQSAHDIADEVEEKIKQTIPGADVLIHQDPVNNQQP